MVTLLIVESPGKIKTLRKILGPGYDVLASVGHICELAHDGPDKLGFDFTPEGAVECRYVPRAERGEEVIRKLKAAVSRSERVLLATDPDREGEAIAWHLARELKLRREQIQRVTYTQITEAAVRAAIRSPRPLDEDLVSAQRCRDVLDKLVGYRASPLAWKVGGRSAGRVQSAALHIVCEREREIRAFRSVDYWSVWCDYQVNGSHMRACYRGGESAAVLDADDAVIDETAELPQAAESTRVMSEREADHLVSIARREPHRVVSVEAREVSKQPPAPFTTSTLQQAAASKLSLDPEGTMRVAQKLYEGITLGERGPVGLITYMRTDSVDLAPEFVAAAREWLAAHDAPNLPERARAHKSRKTAQGAHEAIRPTHVELTPEQLREYLDGEQWGLYDLIWRRAVASQCAPARLDRTLVVSESGGVHWEARGMVVAFAGYATYWNNLEEGFSLPALTEGQALPLAAAGHDRLSTQPPARYSDARLVQMLERLGIGRPSTFASTVATLKNRGYVQPKGKALAATELGLAVDEALEGNLPQLVDARFTAEMETALDEIAEARRDWQAWLVTWNREYLEPALRKAHLALPAQPTTQKTGEPTPATLTEYTCPVCGGPMEEYSYKKGGESKKLLRCSDASARTQDDHREAVYFWTSRGNWWSPSLGEPSAHSAACSSTRPVSRRRGKEQSPVAIDVPTRPGRGASPSRRRR